MEHPSSYHPQHQSAPYPVLQAGGPSQYIYCPQVAATPVISWISYCSRDVTRFFSAGAPQVWILLFGMASSGHCEGWGEQESTLTNMGGSAESEWHKLGQKLQGHTGFGHAKLLAYFQRKRMLINWKHRLAAVFHDGSIVHTLTSDELFRYKASLSDTFP